MKKVASLLLVVMLVMVSSAALVRADDSATPTRPPLTGDSSSTSNAEVVNEETNSSTEVVDEETDSSAEVINETAESNTIYVSISPESENVDPGASVTFTVNVRNVETGPMYGNFMLGGDNVYFALDISGTSGVFDRIYIDTDDDDNLDDEMVLAVGDVVTIAGDNYEIAAIATGGENASIKTVTWYLATIEFENTDITYRIALSDSDSNGTWGTAYLSEDDNYGEGDLADNVLGTADNDEKVTTASIVTVTASGLDNCTLDAISKTGVTVNEPAMAAFTITDTADNDVLEVSGPTIGTQTIRVELNADNSVDISSADDNVAEYLSYVADNVFITAKNLSVKIGNIDPTVPSIIFNVEPISSSTPTQTMTKPTGVADSTAQLATTDNTKPAAIGAEPDYRADNIDLSLEKDNADWTAGLSSISLSIPLGENTDVTLTVGAPSGALANTQCVVTVTGTCLADNIVSASDNCTTIVNVVAGVSISITPESQGAKADKSVAYTVTVTNTGNDNDTITLDVTKDQPGWGATLSKSSVDLAPDASENVTLTVKIDDDADKNDKCVVTVTGTSTNDNTVSASDNCITTCTEAKDLLGAAAGAGLSLLLLPFLPLLLPFMLF